jgi:hypothetical protein
VVRCNILLTSKGDTPPLFFSLSHSDFAAKKCADIANFAAKSFGTGQYSTACDTHHAKPDVATTLHSNLDLGERQPSSEQALDN